MNVFIIPGRLPALSLLELHASLAAKAQSTQLHTVGAEAIIFSAPLPYDAKQLIHRLGGAVKGGQVVYSEKKDMAVLAGILASDLRDRTARASGRITFGISAYSVSQKPLKGNIATHVRDMGISLKKEIKKTGASIRFVSCGNRERALSSVVVDKNHLTVQPNVEYVLLVGDQSIDVGITFAVQEFEQYSFRDYERPHRDMKTGLLPPKLARAMVNLCGADPARATILDPFCGLGTILQEALLLECAAVWGSDIDEKNVRATKENLEWIKNNSGLDPGLRRDDKVVDLVIEKCDARKLLSCFKNNSVDAIITEPTLGPPLSKERPHISRSEIDSLCSLYVASFKAFRDVLKEKGRVVVVFPVWLRNGNPVFIPCIDEIMASGFTNSTIPDSLKNSLVSATSRDSLLIARPDARVARELFVFQKTTR